MGQIDKVVHDLITDDERRIVLRIVLATSDPLTRSDPYKDCSLYEISVSDRKTLPHMPLLL